MLKKVLIPEENKSEIVEFDKDVVKAIKIIPVSEATSILKHSLTKPIIPLNLSESEISQAQKSTFRADNLNENITH